MTSESPRSRRAGGEETEERSPADVKVTSLPLPKGIPRTMATRMLGNSLACRTKGRRPYSSKERQSNERDESRCGRRAKRAGPEPSGSPGQEGGRRGAGGPGGRRPLPRGVFLPFIWTGIGIQFQLSILHLLKQTDTHICTRARAHAHTSIRTVRWKEQKDADQHRNTPEAL